ncbi:MAG: sulfide/dihydroorotate dehydrogenase-like FAD/NAD-binding protein [Clostridiales bacterium]|jgi:ferredoxin--NADP+ reductase|nr:sulfide/dihydroorotate dehydrogenase-like FAD/NAD-binding protein [Clostridiales bacterium]
MYKILKKRNLTENAAEYVVHAPLAAKRCMPGQFVILIVEEGGERIPLTIADYDRERGTITLLVQAAGYSTARLAQKKEGDFIKDFLGPLGNATDLTEFRSVLLAAGGIGSAVVLPQAKYLKQNTSVLTDVVLGGRNASFLTYEEELRTFSDRLFVVTDDGSKGEKGFVTDVIKRLVDGGKKYDAVFAVGPMPMMRAVAELTRKYGIKTIVSMNTIMVDGTGMCGGCRLTVGGEIKHACVDGPEFDGHLVNFEEAMNRAAFYRETEKEHLCRLQNEKKE